MKTTYVGLFGVSERDQDCIEAPDKNTETKQESINV